MSPAWFAPTGPDAVIEITSRCVSAVTATVKSGHLSIAAMATESLPTGAITPSIVRGNINNAAAVGEVLRRVIETLGGAVRRVALVVPDSVARVSLVRFEQVPTNREELAQLIRWQVRNGMPFPTNEGRVSFVRGAELPGSYEFLVTVARESVVLEYERVCTDAGLHPGIVDIATIAVINLMLRSAPPVGDSLLVHVRDDISAVAIMRSGSVLFFRSCTDEDQPMVNDFVHQAMMYYQDRLKGTSFKAVYLAGTGTIGVPFETVRRDVEELLGTPVIPLDPAIYTDFLLGTSLAPRDGLTALVGMALRCFEGTAVA